MFINQVKHLNSRLRLIQSPLAYTVAFGLYSRLRLIQSPSAYTVTFGLYSRLRL